MRHLWQWFCGYICVSLKGRQVNRFLNLCSRNGIRLWRIGFDAKQMLTVHMGFRNLYAIKPYLRKTKTNIKILSKKGFPFWCYRHPKLKWFICICFSFLCLIIYSFHFLWHIEINGNQKVSSQDIFECLNNHEIHVGLNLDSIDCSEIEYILREQFQQLGWVSVYLEHTKLYIEVKESLYDVMEDSLEETGKSYDLIANKEGRISSIITRSGKAVVKENQLVKPGDILVLGQNEVLDDNGEIKEIIYLKADALIFIDHIYNIQIPFSEMEILALKTANKYKDSILMGLGYQKLEGVLHNLQNIQILDETFSVVKDDKNIFFMAKLYVREQIGINIPAEEVRENEFE